MIAVDTNILVYAHRREMPFHKRAVEILEDLITHTSAWAIPWPCLHEFIAVVSHAKIFKTPTPLPVVWDAIATWQQGDNVYFLAEGEGYAKILRELSIKAKIVGPKIHDARVAALCMYHDVSELWSCDRDFSLFPKLKTANPMV